MFVRGVADEGALTLKWGDAADEQCAFGYHLPQRGARHRSAMPGRRERLRHVDRRDQSRQYHQRSHARERLDSDRREAARIE